MTVARLEREMSMDEFVHWVAKAALDAEAMERSRAKHRGRKKKNPFPEGSQEARVFELMNPSSE